MRWSLSNHVTLSTPCGKMASNSSTPRTAKVQIKPSKYRYKAYVQSLNDRDALTLDEFKETRWASYFIVDLSRTYKNGKANPNHVFEHFGSLDVSLKSANVIRQELLQDVATDINFYERCSVVCLAMRSMSLDTWVNHIDNEHMYCDELGLMGLSKMFKHHSVVLTKTKLWSTIDTDAPFNLLELLQQCSVCFVYLGHLRFGSLVWKPRIPTQVVSRPVVPSFEIIEEYTLDGAEATKQTASINHQAGGEKVPKTLPGAASSVTDGDQAIVRSHVATSLAVLGQDRMQKLLQAR